MISNVAFNQVNPSANSPRNNPSVAGEMTNVNNELNHLEDTVFQGYVRESATISYLSNNSFSTTSNTTSFYTPGRLVRLNQGSTPIYVTVLSSSFNGSITTVTVQETTITNPITTVDLAIQPQGFTSNILYSPTIKTPTITNPTITTGTLNNPTIVSRALIVNVPAYAASITLDLSLHDTFSITLTGNVTIVLANGVAGQPFYIELINGNGAANTVTWFAGIKWTGATPPTLTSTSGHLDSFSFFTIATNTYRGFINGLDMG